MTKTKTAKLRAAEKLPPSALHDHVKALEEVVLAQRSKTLLARNRHAKLHSRLQQEHAFLGRKTAALGRAAAALNDVQTHQTTLKLALACARGGSDISAIQSSVFDVQKSLLSGACATDASPGHLLISSAPKLRGALQATAGPLSLGTRPQTVHAMKMSLSRRLASALSSTQDDAPLSLGIVAATGRLQSDSALLRYSRSRSYMARARPFNWEVSPLRILRAYALHPHFASAPSASATDALGSADASSDSVSPSGEQLLGDIELGWGAVHPVFSTIEGELTDAHADTTGHVTIGACDDAAASAAADDSLTIAMSTAAVPLVSKPTLATATPTIISASNPAAAQLVTPSASSSSSAVAAAAAAAESSKGSKHSPSSVQSTTAATAAVLSAADRGLNWAPLTPSDPLQGNRLSSSSKGLIGASSSSSSSSFVPPSEAMAGYVFSASADTAPECLHRMMLGAPAPAMSTVARIVPGYTRVFLYNFDAKECVGVFRAVRCAEWNAVPEAWLGPGHRGRDSSSRSSASSSSSQVRGIISRYPAQVCVKWAPHYPVSITRTAFTRAVGSSNAHGICSELSVDQTIAMLHEFERVNKGISSGSSSSDTSISGNNSSDTRSAVGSSSDTRADSSSSAITSVVGGNPDADAARLRQRLLHQQLLKRKQQQGNNTGGADTASSLASSSNSSSSSLASQSSTSSATSASLAFEVTNASAAAAASRSNEAVPSTSSAVDEDFIATSSSSSNDSSVPASAAAPLLLSASEIHKFLDSVDFPLLTEYDFPHRNCSHYGSINSIYNVKEDPDMRMVISSSLAPASVSSIGAHSVSAISAPLIEAPPVSVGTSNRTCHDFRNGNCRRGDQCAYRHTPVEAITASSTAVPSSADSLSDYESKSESSSSIHKFVNQELVKLEHLPQPPSAAVQSSSSPIAVTPATSTSTSAQTPPSTSTSASAPSAATSTSPYVESAAHMDRMNTARLHRLSANNVAVALCKLSGIRHHIGATPVLEQARTLLAISRCVGETGGWLSSMDDDDVAGDGLSSGASGAALLSAIRRVRPRVAQQQQQRPASAPAASASSSTARLISAIEPGWVSSYAEVALPLLLPTRGPLQLQQQQRYLPLSPLSTAASLSAVPGGDVAAPAGGDQLAFPPHIDSAWSARPPRDFNLQMRGRGR